MLWRCNPINYSELLVFIYLHRYILIGYNTRAQRHSYLKSFKRFIYFAVYLFLFVSLPFFRPLQRIHPLFPLFDACSFASFARLFVNATLAIVFTKRQSNYAHSRWLCFCDVNDNRIKIEYLKSIFGSLVCCVFCIVCARVCTHYVYEWTAKGWENRIYPFF